MCDEDSQELLRQAATTEGRKPKKERKPQKRPGQLRFTGSSHEFWSAQPCSDLSASAVSTGLLGPLSEHNLLARYHDRDVASDSEAQNAASAQATSPRTRPNRWASRMVRKGTHGLPPPQPGQKPRVSLRAGPGVVDERNSAAAEKLAQRKRAMQALSHGLEDTRAKEAQQFYIPGSTERSHRVLLPVAAATAAVAAAPALVRQPSIHAAAAGAPGRGSTRRPTQVQAHRSVQEMLERMAAGRGEAAD